MVKDGSVWTSNDGKRFRVINTTDVEGHRWVYYREDFGNYKSTDGCREFSCFEESFLERFRELPE